MAVPVVAIYPRAVLHLVNRWNDEMGAFFNPANAAHGGGDAVAGADHLTCPERLLRKSGIPAAPPMVALLAAIGQRICLVLSDKDRQALAFIRSTAALALDGGNRR
jgi:hypothetical protein